MKSGICSNHISDPLGTPMGGSTAGRGFAIAWQNGGLAEPDGTRKEPNGAFVEDVIKAAVDRLEYYQQSKFACQYNADAIDLLRQALKRLDDRTKEREQRGVEGTHRV